MIKRLPQGVCVYCDHCDAQMGPFTSLNQMDDEAICKMLDNSQWQTGDGPTRRVQYCPGCKQLIEDGILRECKWCDAVTTPEQPFCSPLCQREWRDAHA